MSGRILVIGDIHGCALTLESLINQIMPTHDDVMVFLGDLIDRGDKSFETVQYCIELKEMFPKTVFIKGNHEDMFINFLKGVATMDEWRMFRYNGGNSTISSYNEALGFHSVDTGYGGKLSHDLLWKDLPKSHQDFYDSLKVFHEIDNYVFVHAGIRPEVKLEDQVERDMVWIREEFLYWPTGVLEGKTIVHGHTPMEREEIDEYNEKYQDKINLDSACVFGYELTCRDLTNNVTYHVKCRDKRIA